MRLSKVNLVRKGKSTVGTPKGSFSRSPSSERSIIGAFWYIREELSDEQARKIARAKQADGYRGNIFHGSAEKIWKATLAKRDTRRSNLHRNKIAKNRPKEGNEEFTGRSYGLLSDDDDDEEVSAIDGQPESQYHSSQQSNVSLATQQDPLSPPLSPPRSHKDRNYSDDNLTPRKTAHRGGEELTPPMPGSFIFEDDAPVSPTFSSTLTESFHNISDHLYSTPDRPLYINPGIALEHRYDTSSPLRNSRFDMTPRQLAAFSRRRQEFEKMMERSATPSVMSDGGTDDWVLSEKDRAEREQRRKDLVRFRLERQRRMHLENSEKIQENNRDNSETRKRPRDALDPMDVEESLEEEVASKRSKSSTIFANALLGDENDQATGNKGSIFGRKNKSADESHVHSPAPSDAYQPNSDDEVEMHTSDGARNFASSTESMNHSTNSYSAPTPSPSPPLNPQHSSTKQSNLHVPKIPSGLRNTTNLSSSPAASPSRNLGLSKNAVQSTSANKLKAHTRVAVDSLLSSSYLTFEFPPLKSSFVAQISPSLLNELSKYF